jgi:hypothetical protein
MKKNIKKAIKHASSVIETWKQKYAIDTESLNKRIERASQTLFLYMQKLDEQPSPELYEVIGILKGEMSDKELQELAKKSKKRLFKK